MSSIDLEIDFLFLLLDDMIKNDFFKVWVLFGYVFLLVVILFIFKFSIKFVVGGIVFLFFWKVFFSF